MNAIGRNVNWTDKYDNLLIGKIRSIRVINHNGQDIEVYEIIVINQGPADMIFLKSIDDKRLNIN